MKITVENGKVIVDGEGATIAYPSNRSISENEPVVVGDGDDSIPVIITGFIVKAGPEAFKNFIGEYVDVPLP